MKNKGFTLAELIAVIVILAVLTLLATGIFINVQRSIIENQYQNLVIDIENRAEEYAEDIGTTDVLYINVEYLITKGYIQADEQDKIYDPRDDSVMNCYMIHIIFEDGEYKADFMEDENLMNNGVCDESSIDTGTVGLLCNGTSCNNGWYNDNLVLSISGLTEEDLINSQVEWTSLLGTYALQESGTEKVLEVNPSTVLNTTYNITITTPEETYKISQNIRIDKEFPVLISSNLEVDYSGAQTLDINASDMGGSGMAGYAITSGDCASLNDSQYTSSSVPITKGGSLNICIKDNSGNVTNEDIYINTVTFNYDNISSDTKTEIPVYYLDENANYPLLDPDRNGYTFDEWVDSEGNRIYNFDELNDGDVVNATWDIIDVSLPVDKIDKDTVGVTIENKINMILVLDISGSMGSNSRLSNLKSVSNNLIDSMSFNVGSTISIIPFESDAYIALTKGGNPSTAKSIINSLSDTGGTNFSAALSTTYSLLTSNDFTKDETFVIFVSDGNGGSPGSYASRVKSLVNTVYSIGVGSSAVTTYLGEIASCSDCYFNANEGLDSLSQIFTKIQDEIREEVTIKSVDGLIELPNLYVTAEYPFILNIGSGDLEFPSISSISDILTVVNGVYYFDLEKVDNKYKLNGNVNRVTFTYYYS